MSSDPKSEDIQWLKESISKNHIKYYEYSDFKELQPIKSGSYGNVFGAIWKNNQFHVLKFNKDKINLNVVKEVVTFVTV